MVKADNRPIKPTQQTTISVVDLKAALVLLAAHCTP